VEIANINLDLEAAGLQAVAEFKNHVYELRAFLQIWGQQQEYILDSALRACMYNPVGNAGCVAASCKIATGSCNVWETGSSSSRNAPVQEEHRAVPMQGAACKLPAFGEPATIRLPPEVSSQELPFQDRICEQFELNVEIVNSEEDVPFTKRSSPCDSGIDFLQMEGHGTPSASCKSSPVNHPRITRQESEIAKMKRKRSGSLLSSCGNRSFEMICGAVIILNAVFIGWSSNYASEHLHNQKTDFIVLSELCFCIFYALEVLLRMYISGRRFCSKQEWKWNTFDLTLVMMSAYDQWENFFTMGPQFENMSFLRIMRLMKMLKLLRMVRLMRMFRELRLILNSVMGCVKSMAWSCVLIVTISYMFGVAFLQACTGALAGEAGPISAITERDIRLWWSSVGTSMLSLYMVSTGGKDWSIVGEPLREVGGIFYALFLLYIAFFLFVVVNTLTSLFVELTIANADHDQQMAIQLELERKDVYVAKLQSLYDEIDQNGDGEITYDEFCKHLDDPLMRAFAASLEIEPTDARQFFCILSEHGKIPVNCDTFVVGCIKLKGMAKSMDLMDLVYSFRRNTAQQEEFAIQTKQALSRLEKQHQRTVDVLLKLLNPDNTTQHFPMSM